jgi:hypothetical protein
MFRALACDYDGTLATGDRIGSAAVAALERSRAAGVRLVLVTGRTFFELTRSVLFEPSLGCPWSSRFWRPARLSSIKSSRIKPCNSTG